MNIQTIARSVLVAVAIAGLLIGGFWIGRLAAGPLTGENNIIPPDISPEEIFNHISTKLDLSDSQKDEIKQILKSHEDEIISQVQAHIGARKAVAQAIMADNVDENLIRERADALGEVEANAALLHAQIHSEVWSVLNDEQKAKIKDLNQKMEQKGDELVSSIQDFLNN